MICSSNSQHKRKVLPYSTSTPFLKKKDVKIKMKKFAFISSFSIHLSRACVERRDMKNMMRVFNNRKIKIFIKNTFMLWQHHDMSVLVVEDCLAYICKTKDSLSHEGWGRDVRCLSVYINRISSHLIIMKPLGKCSLDFGGLFMTPSSLFKEMFIWLKFS